MLNTMVVEGAVVAVIGW